MAEFLFNEDKHEYTLDGKKLMSVTEICSMINGDKFSINESVLRQAQRRGTAVHELTELYDLEIDDDQEIDPSLEGYFVAWQKFCRDYQAEWLFVERKIYSKDLMTAGTIDRVGVIDGVRVVVDIKTTSNMDRTSIISLMLQLSGYCHLMHANDELVDVLNSMGVQLKSDGTYKVYRFKDYVNQYGIQFSTMFLQLADILAKVRGLKNGKE